MTEAALSIEATLAAHAQGEDWHCRCGEDFFGGTGAYSSLAHHSHVIGILAAHVDDLRRQAWDEGYMAGGMFMVAEREYARLWPKLESPNVPLNPYREATPTEETS